MWILQLQHARRKTRLLGVKLSPSQSCRIGLGAMLQQRILLYHIFIFGDWAGEQRARNRRMKDRRCFFARTSWWAAAARSWGGGIRDDCNTVSGLSEKSDIASISFLARRLCYVGFSVPVPWCCRDGWNGTALGRRVDQGTKIVISDRAMKVEDLGSGLCGIDSMPNPF